MINEKDTYNDVMKRLREEREKEEALRLKIEHSCKELDALNSIGEVKTYFTIDPPKIGELYWHLWNNDDDYYSPEYIIYCPYCGKKLK